MPKPVKDDNQAKKIAKDFKKRGGKNYKYINVYDVADLQFFDDKQKQTEDAIKDMRKKYVVDTDEPD